MLHLQEDLVLGPQTTYKILRAVSYGKDFDDKFYACPSCFQEHKETGEYFKLCKCKTRLACNDCAKVVHECSCGERIKNFQLSCSKCKPKKHETALQFDSDNMYSGSDGEVYEEIEQRQKQREDDAAETVDKLCL